MLKNDGRKILKIIVYLNPHVSVTKTLYMYRIHNSLRTELLNQNQGIAGTIHWCLVPW